jgi:uncharacterized repeat protein (TIGR01451 family)
VEVSGLAAALFLVVFLTAACALPAAGQTVPLPAVQNRVGLIDDTKLITLPGHVHPLARAEYDQGVVDDSLPVEHLIVVLQRSPEQAAAATVLVDQLHNRNSAQFHQWLTPEDFGKHFGPSDSDLQKLTSWLQAKGFTIDDVPPGRTHVTISGTAGQVRSTLHAELHNLNVNGEKHIAVLTDPQIPAALAPVVAGFRQLNDWHAKPQYHPAGVFKRDQQTGAWQKVSSATSAPEATFNDNGIPFYIVGPQDWYTIYNSGPLYQAGINGAGTTIAVLEETEVGNQGDVGSFRSEFGLPAYPATPNSTQGGVNWVYGPGSGCAAPPTLMDGEEAEALIDVEWAGAIAPNAIVDFVACNSTGSGIGSWGTDLAASYVANYLSSTVVATSLSYGECEIYAGSSGALFYLNLWQQLAAEGVTAVVAAGDAGSLTCDQDWPYALNNLSTNALSSTPYNISAGGTDFSDNYQTAWGNDGAWWSSSNSTGYSSALSYVPEISWGGRCSDPLAVSYWQQAGVTTFGTTYTPLAICNSTEAGPDYYDYVAPVGGGGGISQYNPMPAWQGGVYGIGNTSTSTTYRNEPDLSFFASAGWWGHFLPFCESDLGYPCDFATDAFAQGAGGTSFVAPQIAGLMALVNQQTNSRQGVANYTLYNLATAEYGTVSAPNGANLSSCSGSGQGAAVGSTCIFRDIANDTPSLQGGTITSGIVQPCMDAYVTNCYAPDGETYGLSAVGDHTSTLAYETAQGYDDATGLGSANVYNLVMGWNHGVSFASTTALSANPATLLNPAATATLTATVAAAGRGGQVAPVGTVSFYLGSTGGTLLGTSNLSSLCSGSAGSTTCSGVATLPVQGSQLNPGPNSILAYFGGDGANDTPSTSSAVNITYQLAPDLTISKSHTGNFIQGQTGATYTIAVSNVGGAASSGTVAVTDLLPAGLTVTAMGGTGWTCTLNTLTCARADALAAGGSYPAITLAVNVAAHAPASLTNTAAVSGGGDLNPGNNSASDLTTILLAGPDLAISKTHSGNFVQEQTGATYTITVSNVGGSASSGAVTVTDTLPAGLAATAISGTGWTCTLSMLTCTRADSLAGGGSYPAITLTANVAGNAPGSVTNTATVSGGGDVNSANNVASDVTTILVLQAGGTITTVAGNGIAGYGGDGGPATSAELNGPISVAADAAGNLYFPDINNNVIRKVSATTGVITTVAGNGSCELMEDYHCYSGDGGPATSAELDWPYGVAVDTAGNLYIADTENAVIRKVSAATGVITTVAGDGFYGYSGDGGPARSAELNYPAAVAVDAAGNLYIADYENNVIREVNAATDVITTVAGNGAAGYSGDGGPATSAELVSPIGVAVDAAGNFYIADWEDNVIREVNASSGVITTMAGNGNSGYAGDGGPAIGAELKDPSAVAVDAAGNLFIADAYNNRIRQVSAATGVITTVAGKGIGGYSGDYGPGTSAELNDPQGVTLDAAGNLYIADTSNNRVREVMVAQGTWAATTTVLTSSANPALPASPVTFTATVTTGGNQALAGMVSFFDGSIPLGMVTLNSSGIAAYTTSNLTLGNHSITAVYSGNSNYMASTSAALTQTIAGNAPVPVLTSLLPSSAYAGESAFLLTVNGSGFVSSSTILWNGSILPAAFLSTTQLQATITPDDIATAGAATVTVSTPAPGGGISNSLTFNIQNDPIITTVAGNGTEGYSGDDGQAISAELNNPIGVAADFTGNLYIADYDNDRIRRVDARTGTITTVAGNGNSGYSGDGHLATSAELNYPYGVAVDLAGNLYIADTGNNVIREVSAAAGTITTVAGNGTSGYSGDGGPATSAKLSCPERVAVDMAGNLYIVDACNSRIREVSAATGVITTVAGNGTYGYSGDGGPATSAELAGPSDIKVDEAGNLYIADPYNSRVREVSAATGVMTTVAGSGIFGDSGDGGPATSAELSRCYGVAVDAAGNLYVADSWNSRVREVNAATGVIMTVAGDLTAGYGGDGGPSISAELNDPVGLAFDVAGNLYIADIENQRIREVVFGNGTRAATTTIVTSSANPALPASPVTFTATVTTAGAQAPVGAVTLYDGAIPLIAAALNSSGAITYTTSSLALGTHSITAFYTGDPNNLSSTSAVLSQTIAGDAPVPVLTSLSPSSAYAMESAFILTVNGSDFVSTSTVLWNGSIRATTFLNSAQLQAAITAADIGVSGSATVTVLTPAPGGGVSNGLAFNIQMAAAGTIVTVAGNGSAGFKGDGGPATAAELNLYAPSGVVLDAAGNLYISDTDNSIIREVSAMTGMITTVAGNGNAGDGGDGGPATSAGLYRPSGVAVDTAGNLYIADTYNSRIREVNATTGVITTVAGDGLFGYSGDGGPATSAELSSPEGVAVDAAGNLYIADTANSRIREVSAAAGVITTVAGGGNAGLGDGGPAASAELNEPVGLAVDAAGDLYIADTENYRIREVSVGTGVITTVAGDGNYGRSGDGSPATSAELEGPESVTVDMAGNLYIADPRSSVIRRVDANGIITTVAGDGTAGYSGDDGLATSAELSYPSGVAVNAAGNLFIADTGNQRIREVLLASETRAATTTVLNSSANPALPASPVTFTATVTTTGTQTPMGSVTFYDGTTLLSGAGLNGSGVAAYTTSSLALGTSSITAFYSGDPNNLASTSAPLSQTIAGNAPTPVVTSLSPDNACVGCGDFSLTVYGSNFVSSSTVLWNGGSRATAFVSSSQLLAAIAAADIATAGSAMVTVSTPAPGGGVSNGLTLNIQVVPVISTVAGDGYIDPSTGGGGYSGDGGPAISADLNYPDAVVLDASGNLFIADSNNNRIREVNVSTGVITTVAGNGTEGYSGDGGPATSAELNNPEGVVEDAAGNLFIADSRNNRIREVSAATGIITTVAGNGIRGYKGDGGPATSAELYYPAGVAVDAAGNLYISDTFNHRIRRVSAATGLITTIAGTGKVGYSGNGDPATGAELFYPGEVALDAAGNLFIADSGNSAIREVSAATGVITTVAGDGTYGYSGDGGPATSAELNYPEGVTVDAAGDLFIADTDNFRVREVSTSGTITTIAGDGIYGYNGDDRAATSAELNYPVSVVLDGAGNLFIADTDNQRIREVVVASGTRAATTTALTSNLNPAIPASPVTFTATVTTAGSQTPEGEVSLYDGSAALGAAALNSSGIATYTTSSLAPGTHLITAYYGGDANNLGSHSAALSQTIAGNAPVPVLTSLSPSNAYVGSNAFTLTVEGADFISTSTVLWNGGSRATTFVSSTQLQAAITAADIATAGSATVTVSTPAPGGGVSNGLSFNVKPIPLIATVAGNGIAGYSGDGGPATSAQLYYPEGVAADVSGNLYIADSDNNVVRQVSATGVITTVAGNGTGGYSGDGGPAASAELHYPSGVAVDESGNLYIADYDNERIRKVNAATGVITTVAGNGKAGYSGDGGPATSGELHLPYGVAVDGSGNLYIADIDNERIREVSATTGVITTVAGDGTKGYSGDGGPATSAELSSPKGVAVDASGNLYIADTVNERIREVSATTGVISTVAGDGTYGYTGDGGLAISAELHYPEGVAVDASGNLYIADTENLRIREVSAVTGVITTVAGDGVEGYSGDGGPATSAELNFPGAVAVDVAGNLYIADTDNAVIREVGFANPARAATTTTLTSSANPIDVASPLTFTATVSTAGTQTPAGWITFYDGSARLSTAELNSSGVAVYTTSTLAPGMQVITAFYSGDPNNLASTSASLTETVVAPVPVLTSMLPSSIYAGGNGFTLTVVGSNFVSSSAVLWNGSSRTTTFLSSTQLQAAITAADIVITGSATVTVSTPAPGGGVSSSLVFNIQPLPNIFTVAGDGSFGYGGDNGVATRAELYTPHGVAVDAAGNIYIADYANERVRKVSAATGIITTVAGNGARGYKGDGGPATSAELYYPAGVAVDAAGNLYIADMENNRIRAVNMQASAITILEVTIQPGDIATVAGNGTRGYISDGVPATSTALYYPAGVALDASGNLYIADTNNERVREVSAAAGVISTVAGDGTKGYSGDGSAATSAELAVPNGVAVDADGNLYIADMDNYRVRGVNAATGVITTLAGNGKSGYSGDGRPATTAELHFPAGVAVDMAGNLYIADMDNQRVRQVSAATGIIATIAGNGTAGYSGDGGPAINAELYDPEGVALDAVGDLYIADTENSVIREVVIANGMRAATTTALSASANPAVAESPLTFTATVTTAGSQMPVGWVMFYDGSAWLGSAGLNSSGVASYTTSNLAQGTHLITAYYGGDLNNLTSNSAALSETILAPVPALTSLSPSSIYAESPAFPLTVNGSGFVSSSTVLWNGNSRTTTFINSKQLQAAITAADVATAGSATITVSTPAPGGGVSNGLIFGVQPPPIPVLTSLSPSSAGARSSAFTLTVNGLGFVGTSTVLWNGSNRATTCISSTQLQAAITAADIATVGSVTVTVSTPAPGGGVSNGLVFEIPLVPLIATVAGNGIPGYNGDGGLATSAELSYPTGVAVDAAGNFYIADTQNEVIREVNVATGVITTVAGTGASGYSGDGGPAIGADLHYPNDVTVDAAGNLYIADMENERIREVNAVTGVITTVAGTGTWGYSGDGGPATGATLNWPAGVRLDGAGNLYIADANNNVIREVSAATGLITTVAGNGNGGYSGDGGPATNAELYEPERVAVDAVGDLYIADTYNSCIREVNATTGVITTVAGNGTAGYSGDGGPATSAELSYPGGVAGDTAGNLYIADTSNSVIRQVIAATGVITTMAGNGTVGYSGDGGAATSAELYYPTGVAVDLAGNGYIADTTNSVIREIPATPALALTSLTSMPNPSSYGQAVVFTAVVTSTSCTPSSGTMTFSEGTNVLATVGVNSAGTALYTTSTLGAATYTIAAQYSGSSSCAGSTGSVAQTVNPAPLTVTANNQSMTYGGAIPPLTCQVAGAVNGDVITCSATTTSSPTVAGSPYAIVPSAAGSALGNYTVGLVNGELTVNPATPLVTVTCNPNPVTYTGQPIPTSPDCTATVTGAGGLNASLPVSPAYMTATGPVSASYGGSQNYTSAYGSTTWTLTPGTIDCSVTDSQGNVLSSGVQEQYGTVLNVTCVQPALSKLSHAVSGPGSYALNAAKSAATLKITDGAGSVTLTLSEVVNHVTSTWSFTVNAAPVPVTFALPGLPLDANGNPYYQYVYGVAAARQPYILPTQANGGIKQSPPTLVGTDHLSVKVEMFNLNTGLALSLSGDPLTEAISAGGKQYELLPVVPSTTKYDITFASAPMYYVADYTATTIEEKNPAKDVWGPVENIAAGISALSQYSFKVTNKSGADVVWTATGSDPTNFTISPSPCPTYRLGASPATTCEITVAFAPGNPLAVGTYTEQITIIGVDQSTGAAVFNTLVSPAVTDTLNAYVYSDNGITVTPSSPNFPVAGGEVLFTVGNVSGYAATLAAPKFSKAAEFAVDANNSTCPTTTPLQTQSTCTLAVMYTPPARHAPAATPGYATMTIGGSITPIPGGRAYTLAKDVVELNLE